MKKLKDGTFFVRVGETFTTEDGTKLRCELCNCGCEGCDFSETGVRNHSKRPKEALTLKGCNGYVCFRSRRPDNKHVIFVRV